MARAVRKSVAIDTVPLPERVVRVSIPPKIANNLRNFQKAQVLILDRLGCHACCSGWDIHWDVSRSFGIDEKLNVIEGVAGVVIIDG